MKRVVFSDNDIILKLSEYDLLHQACKVLAVTPDQVMILHNSKHYFRRLKEKTAKGKLASYSCDGIERAVQFSELAHGVEEYPNLDWFAEIDNIDIGEAQLATWAVKLDTVSLLLSGDKRFIKALAAPQSCKNIFDRLSSRVVCLESLVKAMIRDFGFDFIRNAIARCPQCDRSLSIVFGSQFNLPEPQVVDGLESLIRDIILTVGDTWLNHP